MPRRRLDFAPGGAEVSGAPRNTHQITSAITWNGRMRANKTTPRSDILDDLFPSAREPGRVKSNHARAKDRVQMSRPGNRPSSTLSGAPLLSSAANTAPHLTGRKSQCAPLYSSCPCMDGATLRTCLINVHALRRGRYIAYTNGYRILQYDL